MNLFGRDIPSPDSFAAVDVPDPGRNVHPTGWRGGHHRRAARRLHP